jgi:uncharacterized protein (DUF433 family)
MDWSGCPLVVSRAGYLSGKPALRDDPRVPPETIVVNMDDGMTAQQVAEMFGLRTPVVDILAIYDYAKKQRAPSSV